MTLSTRLAIALATQVGAILFSLMSWTDPVNGGFAMALAMGLTAVSWLIGRVPFPRFTWVTATVSAAFLVVFWAVFLAELPADPAEQANYSPSDLIVSMAWAHRILAIVFVCAIVFYAVVQFTARRNAKTGDK